MELLLYATVVVQRRHWLCNVLKVYDRSPIPAK